jgi:hypothetical protein
MPKIGFVLLPLAILWACSDGASGPGDSGTGSSSGSASSSGSDGSSGPDGSSGSSSSSSSGGSSSSAGSSSGGGDSGKVSGPLPSRLGISDVTVSAGVKPGEQNWRIWGQSSLGVAPVYTAPLANCGTLVCMTAGSGDSLTGTSEAYVLVLDANDKLVRSIDLGAFECRGLAAESDDHFAALLWAKGPASDCADFSQNGRIYLKRFDTAGTPGWSTELVDNAQVYPACPNDWTLGDSRLEFGGGKYGAYYHVHSQSGHEGDAMMYVDLTGAATIQWGWGCSHSMSNVLRFSAPDMEFMPACVTDCYPGTNGNFTTMSQGGVYVNDQNDVINVDAGCDGSVAGELGGAAPGPHGYKMVFNAHQNPLALGQSSYDPSTMNQDIGFASIATALMSSPVVWLTTTPSVNEADASIERWQPSDDPTEQYVVGWSEPGNAYAYKLGRVDAQGKFLEGPVDVTATARWGRRDDPFRAHYDADVVWGWFDAAGATTLHFARLRSGGTYACAAF